MTDSIKESLLDPENEHRYEVVQAFVVHPTAVVRTDRIGPGTRIWAYVHVLDGAEIGRDCNIGDHCYIESGVKIGSEVVVKNGVSIWTGIIIEDRVFIGPNVAFTNDLFPRAKLYRDEYGCTLISEGASIGANATLLCSLTIGRFAMIGAGSVVTQNVQDFALVYGNPARQHGWICKCGTRLQFPVDTVSSTHCICGLRYQTLDGIVSELK